MRFKPQAQSREIQKVPKSADFSGFRTSGFWRSRGREIGTLHGESPEIDCSHPSEGGRVSRNHPLWGFEHWETQKRKEHFDFAPGEVPKQSRPSIRGGHMVEIESPSIFQISGI
jgi:hypothetical protein